MNDRDVRRLLTIRYAMLATACLIAGMTGYLVGVVTDSPRQSQERVLLLDIVDMQPRIDDQYDRVLDDVTDHSRYDELRRLIDDCFGMVNDYNDIRDNRWPYMPSEYCDRIFP